MARIRPKICKFCNVGYEADRENSRYCTKACRIAANNQKRRKEPTFKKRLNRMVDNDDFRWIIGECIRAETVEILQGTDLVALLDLIKRSRKTYSYNPETKKRYFHICHVVPARGDEFIGLLHHDNLFIGKADHNQKHGNRCLVNKPKLAIRRDQLKDEWLVKKSYSYTKVRDMMVAYLGDTLESYAKQNPIDTSPKIRLAKKIFKSKSTDHSLSELQVMSTHELRSLEGIITKKPSKKFTKTRKRTFLVNLEECGRHSNHNPNARFLLPYITIGCLFLTQEGEYGLDDVIPWNLLRYCPKLELGIGKTISKFRDWMSNTVSEVLHGGQINHESFRSTFLSYLVVDSTPEQLSENFEAYKFKPAVANIYDAYNQIGFPDLVVRKHATQHTAKPSATRPATISVVVNNTQKGDVNICNQNQVSNKDSVNTCTNIEWITSRIRMANHSTQSPMQYMMAS